MTQKIIFLAQKLACLGKKPYLCGIKGNGQQRKEADMQATAQNYPTGQTRPMSSIDYALADIAAGRINHYNSLEELINKFK